MPEGAPTTYKHEQTQYSIEEFMEKFSNFHLVFKVDRPFYMSDVKEVLQDEKNDPILYEKFKKIKEEFKKQSSEDVLKNNIQDLFDIYIALRKKGFSNKQLGLIYW